MVGNSLVGKKLKIFYDDLSSVSCKEGVCSDDSDISVELDHRIIIPRNRIIRIEVVQ